MHLNVIPILSGSLVDGQLVHLSSASISQSEQEWWQASSNNDTMIYISNSYH